MFVYHFYVFGLFLLLFQYLGSILREEKKNRGEREKKNERRNEEEEEKKNGK